MTINRRTEKLIQMIGNRACPVVADVYEPEAVRGTVFCMHGLIGNGADFENLAIFLADNGLRVVCPDRLGRGRSTHLADPDAYNLQTHLETVRLLLGRFGSGQDSVIGSGEGAALALLFSRLSNFLPRRLILADLVVAASPRLTALSQLMMELINAVFENPEEVDRFWINEGEMLGLDMDQANYPSLVKYLKKTEDGYSLSCDKSIAFTLDSPIKFDLSPFLQSLRTPSLMLYGRSSHLFDGAVVERVTSANPGVKCLPEFGDYSTIVFDDFQVFSTIFGFLSGNYERLSS